MPRSQPNSAPTPPNRGASRTQREQGEISRLEKSFQDGLTKLRTELEEKFNQLQSEPIEVTPKVEPQADPTQPPTQPQPSNDQSQRGSFLDWLI